MKCIVNDDIMLYQRQVDEQALFDIDREKAGAQMLVELGYCTRLKH